MLVPAGILGATRIRPVNAGPDSNNCGSQIGSVRNTAPLDMLEGQT
jgi:hypothetical protein